MPNVISFFNNNSFWLLPLVVHFIKSGEIVLMSQSINVIPEVEVKNGLNHVTMKEPV